MISSSLSAYKEQLYPSIRRLVEKINIKGTDFYKPDVGKALRERFKLEDIHDTVFEDDPMEEIVRLYSQEYSNKRKDFEGLEIDSSGEDDDEDEDYKV